MRNSKENLTRSDSQQRINGPPPGFNALPAGGKNKQQLRRSGSKKNLRPNAPEVTPLVPTPGRWQRPKNVDEEEALYRKVKGILNKLTEENFDRLSNKLLAVGIDSIDILRGIIKLVFDKALAEPKFSPMYAQLCRKVAENTPDFSVDGKTQTFKRLLLNRCQEEFESSFKPVKKDDSNTLTREEKLQLAEEEFLTKKIMLGNITFIGELYKIKMLTEKIIHECITKLLGDLKNPSLEDMEALCKLMTGVGSQLDHQKARTYMDQYFARMSELSKNKTLPSRIRFMLQDVLQLRKNNWLSRQEAQASHAYSSPKASPLLDQSTRPGRQAPPHQNITIAQRGSIGRGANVAHTRSNSNSNAEWEVVQNRSSKQDSRLGQQPTRYSSQEDLKLRPQTTLGPLGRGSDPYGKTARSESSDRLRPEPSEKPNIKQQASKRNTNIKNVR